MIVPSHLSALSPQLSLELTNVYLENAYKTTEKDIALVLCRDAETALTQAKSATKKYPIHLKDTQSELLKEGIASAYIDLGKLLDGHGYQIKAQAISKKAEKWRIVKKGSDSMVGFSAGANQPQPPRDIATILPNIFAVDVGPPTSEIKLPEADEPLINTLQLACCLGLLQASCSSDDILEPTARNWLQTTEKDTDEQDRLKVMATDVIRAFKRDEIKDAKVVAEVVYLSPVLNKDSFKDLLNEFYKGINQSVLLDIHQLEGLAQIVQGTGPDFLEADDLVKILDLLSTRLRGTHQQSPQYIYRLTMAVSNVLDAMADTQVKDLDRVNLHEPLMLYLKELKESSDSYFVYQATYAY
ncbi:hypothetical protein BGZ65_007653 [Modicella reniformis]|uniref:Arm-like repeat domain-containing protein n=1 Tax=Modicella reniformis TaxID=1440133 RepID=A0A9P6IJS4_9FUNG|nr:hypothetical protein BGZ65_007653 [Modicella reniformis]